MKHKPFDRDDSPVAVQSRIDVPPSGRPTAAEIERRRIIVERMLARSDRVGPIGIRADDLLHEARAESEA